MVCQEGHGYSLCNDTDIDLHLRYSTTSTTFSRELTHWLCPGIPGSPGGPGGPRKTRSSPVKTSRSRPWAAYGGQWGPVLYGAS